MAFRNDKTQLVMDELHSPHMSKERLNCTLIILEKVDVDLTKKEADRRRMARQLVVVNVF